MMNQKYKGQKANYEQVYDGEPIEVPKIWIVACCDCGLVHQLEFFYVKPKGKKRQKLMVKVFVDKSRTKAKRKNGQHKCQLVVK